MLLMETLPALFFFVMCVLIPESPRWLAKNQRDAEALAILEKVNGAKTAAAELADIEATVAQESGSVTELWRPGVRRALLMALFLAFTSEFSGITTIWNFGPEIIRGRGIQLTNELSGMVVIASSLTVFTMLAVWLMDHAGRRRLLFWGNLGCLLSLVFLGRLLGREDSSSAMKVAAAACFRRLLRFLDGTNQVGVYVGSVPHKDSGPGDGH